MRTALPRFVPVLMAVCLLVAAVPGATAQEPKSVTLAKELGQVLTQSKLDAIAAKDPTGTDTYVAALYFSGSQLLVVSAKYSVPAIMNEKLAKKEYRDVYSDLNSACVAGSKVFVMDMGADGLRPDRTENKIDTWEADNQTVSFDGDWKKQKIASEDAYTKTFAAADERYAKVLSALIAQAKKQ